MGALRGQGCRRKRQAHASLYATWYDINMYVPGTWYIFSKSSQTLPVFFILGVSNTFHTPSTESIAVLVA